jgi:hypothetical protein
MQYRQPLLFADLLTANSIVDIEKMVQNDNFQVKNWTFYLRIQDSRSKTTERIYRK